MGLTWSKCYKTHSADFKLKMGEQAHSHTAFSGVMPVQSMVLQYNEYMLCMAKDTEFEYYFMRDIYILATCIFAALVFGSLLIGCIKVFQTVGPRAPAVVQKPPPPDKFYGSPAPGSGSPVPGTPSYHQNSYTPGGTYQQQQPPTPGRASVYQNPGGERQAAQNPYIPT